MAVSRFMKTTRECTTGKTTTTSTKRPFSEGHWDFSFFLHREFLDSIDFVLLPAV